MDLLDQRSFELRDLRYFEIVAELGHLGRAAKKVGRSQPALTKCIHRLEESFKAPLFDRVGRGIRLTAVGEALLARARLLRGAANEAVREIDDLAQGIAGHVRIGSGPITAEYLLPGICKLLLAQGKDVTVEVVIGWTDDLRTSLRAGRLDLILAAIPEVDDEFISQTISIDEVVVVACKSHPVFKKKPRLRDLLDYKWVLPAASVPTRQWLDQAFVRKNLPKPTVQIEANSISALSSVITDSELLSFRSRRTLGMYHGGEKLREVKLAETTLRRRFGISHRRDGYLAPAARRLLKFLPTQAEKLFAV